MSIDNTAQDINNALRDPVPELQDAESVRVTLQRGLVDPTSGLWQTEAEVREMTGTDEEYLATIEAKSELTYGEYISTLLRRTVNSIGSISIEADKSHIDNLSIGDRDILFLGVIRATYGKTKQFQAECRSCSTLNDVEINLDEDFPVKEPTVDLKKPLKFKLKNDKTVSLRVPTVADSAQVTKVAKSPAAQNTMMLARCAIFPDGKQPKDVDEWARSLNVADRNKLIRSLLEIEAGPELKAVNVHCASCGEEMTIALDWISLLLV